MLVFVLQKLLSLLGLLGQNIMLLCHYKKKIVLVRMDMALYSRVF